MSRHTLTARESESFLDKLRIRWGVPLFSTPFLRYNTSRRNVTALAQQIVAAVVASSPKYPFYVLLNLSVTAQDDKHANVLVFRPGSKKTGGWDMILFEPNGVLDERYDKWGSIVRNLLQEIQSLLGDNVRVDEILEDPINIVGGNCDALCLYFIFLNAPHTTLGKIRITSKKWFKHFDGATKKELFRNVAAATKNVLKTIRDGRDL